MEKQNDAVAVKIGRAQYERLRRLAFKERTTIRALVDKAVDIVWWPNKPKGKQNNE